ncbi:MAG: hypothetical protein IJ087_09295 [Eggerthellaceae bacterium]|nr:hypothetical protein [Eggerthellaceae bacterium]
MARTLTYNEYGAPCVDPITKTAVAHDYRNSRGDKAVILHRNGQYEVHSAFYKCKGFKSLKTAAHELIDHSPIGCSDWEAVA